MRGSKDPAHSRAPAKAHQLPEYKHVCACRNRRDPYFICTCDDRGSEVPNVPFQELRLPCELFDPRLYDCDHPMRARISS